MKMEFYRCEICGNIIVYVKNSGVKVVCCGKPMTAIVPHTIDLGAEKHVPVIEQKGNEVKVKIGSTEHPMSNEHYIEWIFLQTKQGNQRKQLKPTDKPEVCFSLCNKDKVEAAYEYCNIHGLWKTELKK